jgi:transposase-like protein
MPDDDKTTHDYILDKSSSFPYTPIHESNTQPFLGMRVTGGTVRMLRFKSFFIEANSFRVGTFLSSLRFSSIGDLDMNLADLSTQFSTDECCRELLRRLRWPLGVECPRCKQAAIELETEKELFYCKDCDYQFTVTAGTIFNDSHLPLTKWFMATLLLCEAKKGISACQVQRTIGVSYKTAWYLCHRIRAAMAQADKPMLDGKVEMDETYVGGINRGRGRNKRLENKEIVIGIRQRDGQLRLFHSKDIRSKTMAEYIRENVSEDVDVIFTDDYPSYPSAMKKAGVPSEKHKTINHSEGIYVMGDTHTNTIENAFSLFKRGVRGTWHHISPKHLSSYLEEMEFRFNRRKDRNLFSDTLRHMVTASALTFERLTA